VNEKQWLSSDRPIEMLAHARHRVPQRQILLFVADCLARLAACSRRRRPSPEDPLFDTLVAQTRRYADGEVTHDHLDEALAPLREQQTGLARWVCSCLAWALDFPGANPVAAPAKWPEGPTPAALLRCVTGNPFRSVTLDPAWLTGNEKKAEQMARRIRDEDDFAALPILADALEEAGCTDKQLLAHCRGSHGHTRGCWLLELLLDRPEPRRPIEETWPHLERQELEMPRTPKGEPFVKSRMPHPGDEGPLGFYYYKHHVEDADLANLTLPRTFFGRSGLYRVRFRNTDLSQSWMCWNDFIDCDFSGAELSDCQMRASIFSHCRFVGANLCQADMRRSSFKGCDFTHARMNGAKAHHPQREEYRLWRRLSEPQQKAVQWSEDPGPEPDGG
jgi:hypothetical protein